MYRAAFAVASSIKAATSKKQLASRVLAARQYVAKDINYGVGARSAMLQGINEVADVVKLTMGPRGRNVIIEKSQSEPKVTKDGSTVAKAIEFQGTTCTTVLAQAILTEGCKAVAAGVNVMDFSIVSYLKRKAVMICTPEEIAQVASVSANCDPEIGDLIVRALEKVGKDGVITVSGWQHINQ